MSGSLETFTFGVEIEFALAYVVGTNSANPSEIRTVKFDTIEHDFWYPYAVGYPGMAPVEIEAATTTAAHRHIRATLERAGFPVNGPLTTDTAKWTVGADTSIEAPEYEAGYRFTAVEIASPAYYCVPEALRAVEELLALLTSTYVLNVNKSTGLHVHVGQGTQGFTFDALKKLVSFLFAFTPQLDTLHPPERLVITDQTYAGSLRENSRYEVKRRPTHKVRPSPTQAVARILSSETMVEMFRLFEGVVGPRCMAYDFSWLQQKAKGEPNGYGFKPTIEFRQHAGCLDGPVISTWIKTVVGIVDFCQNASTSSFWKLLTLVDLEKWEKLGDGLDAQREFEHGPTAADGKFTVIKLLQALKLWDSARFYQERGLYRHQMNRSPTDQTDMWDYEQHPPQNPAVLEREASLRRAWEAVRAASKARDIAQLEFTNWNFDPADPIWPVHDHSLNESADTDATSPSVSPTAPEFLELSSNSWSNDREAMSGNRNDPSRSVSGSDDPPSGRTGSASASQSRQNRTTDPGEDEDSLSTLSSISFSLGASDHHYEDQPAKSAQAPPASFAEGCSSKGRHDGLISDSATQTRCPGRTATNAQFERERPSEKVISSYLDRESQPPSKPVVVDIDDLFIDVLGSFNLDKSAEKGAQDTSNVADTVANAVGTETTTPPPYNLASKHQVPGISPFIHQIQPQTLADLLSITDVNETWQMTLERHSRIEEWMEQTSDGGKPEDGELW